MIILIAYVLVCYGKSTLIRCQLSFSYSRWNLPFLISCPFSTTVSYCFSLPFVAFRCLSMYLWAIIVSHSCLSSLTSSHVTSHSFSCRLSLLLLSLFLIFSSFVFHLYPMFLYQMDFYSNFHTKERLCIAYRTTQHRLFVYLFQNVNNFAEMRNASYIIAIPMN